MGTEYTLSLFDGKYTLIRGADYRMRALRYGEPWRDLTGDHLVAVMLERIEDHETLDQSRRELVRRLDQALNGEGAAAQATLADLVSQVGAEVDRRGAALLTLLRKWDIEDIMTPAASALITGRMSKAQAKAAGYTVDESCYPWIAYKGPRFQPTTHVAINTDRESDLERALAAALREKPAPEGEVREVEAALSLAPPAQVVPSNELPDGYRLGHRDSDWWPLLDRKYISDRAYPSKAHAVLAAWQHSHEKLRSSMEQVRKLAAALTEGGGEV